MEEIRFGRYWSGTGLENTPIDWLVLDETDEYLFVVSKQAIASKAFDLATANWKESSIRKWLNDDFIELAFNDDEKSYILEKEIDTTNDFESIWGGFSQMRSFVKTTDKVFLLSVEAADHFFKTAADRVVQFSQYAIDGLEDERKSLNCWWLRNQGEVSDTPLLVDENGNYYEYAAAQNIEGIRPAMCIKRSYTKL